MGFKLFLLLEKFLMALPKKQRKNFFSALATLGYKVSKKYRRIADINLDYAFDNKMSSVEKDEIIRYSFKNLSYNFLHLMELRHLTKDELKNKIAIQNIEAVNKVHKDGRAIIYVTTHYCSWL